MKLHFFFLASILFFSPFLFCGSNLKAQYFTTSKNKLDSRFKIEYTTSYFDKSENIYIDKIRKIKIDPKKSAIVLIDLWDERFLDSMIIKFINPLIDEASKMGMKIIYAPSQRKQNKKLIKIDKQVILYNLDVMDKYLFNNKIENLFYVGYDALYCILDKPNGIFSYKMRDYNESMKIFLIAEGVASDTEEMKETAMSLLKKHNVGIMKKNSLWYKETFQNKTKKDINEKTIKKIPKGRNFVVIFENDSANRELENFKNSLKQKNIDFGIVTNEKLNYNDQIILSNYDFICLLKKKKIKNLYYSGYYLNNEIMWSNFGITSIYTKKRYYGIEDLPDLFVINNLSYIIPSTSIDPELEKAVILNHYRNIENILSKMLIK